jgi:outer membrane protein TolC
MMKLDFVILSLMRQIFLVGGPVFLMSLPTQAQSPTGNILTLQRAFELALEVNENLKIQENDVQNTINLQDAARANNFPGLRFLARTGYIDNVPSRIVANTTSVSVNFSQNIYNGHRDWAQVNALKWAEKSQMENVRKTKWDLYEWVVARYFNYLRLEVMKENLKEQKKILTERALFIAARAKVGRMRQADGVLASGQVVALDGQIAGVESDLQRAWEELNLLINLNQNQNHLDQSTTNSKLQIPEDVTLPFVGLEDGGSLLERPEYKMLEFDQKRFESLTTAERASFFPVVSFEANAYALRNGAWNNSHWDVQLNFTWQLYEGGARYANLRNLSLSQQSLSLRRNQQLRTHTNLIKTYQGQLTNLEIQLAALEKADGILKKSYQLQKIDQDNSLSTPLEVLGALNSYWDNRRQFEQVRLDHLQLKYLFNALLGFGIFQGSGGDKSDSSMIGPKEKKL